MPVPAPRYWINPAYKVAKVGNPFNNNGGTIFAGGGVGTLQNNRLFDSIFGSMGLVYMGIRSGKSDAGPVIGSGTGSTKGLSSGAFATMTAGQYILMTFTSQVAGTANTTLRFAASPFRKSQNTSIPWINTRQIVTTGGFYMYNGLPVNATITRDPVNTDVATTYALPGRLTTLSTGKSPSSQNYAAKTD